MANCCKDFMVPLFPALTLMGTIVLPVEVTKSTSALPVLPSLNLVIGQSFVLEWICLLVWRRE